MQLVALLIKYLYRRWLETIRVKRCQIQLEHWWTWKGIITSHSHHPCHLHHSSCFLLLHHTVIGTLSAAHFASLVSSFYYPRLIISYRHSERKSGFKFSSTIRCNLDSKLKERTIQTGMKKRVQEGRLKRHKKERWKTSQFGRWDLYRRATSCRIPKYICLPPPPRSHVHWDEHMQSSFPKQITMKVELLHKWYWSTSSFFFSFPLLFVNLLCPSNSRI